MRLFTCSSCRVQVCQHARLQAQGQEYPVLNLLHLQHNRTSPVARMIVSNNTLQHLRGDASRRTSVSEGNEEFVRLDYTVQPRYTQKHKRG